MQFYYAEGDQQKGPVDVGQLRSAGVRPDTLVWREGMPEWQEANRVPDLADLFAPPAGVPAGPQLAGEPSPEPYATGPDRQYVYAPQPYAPPGGPPAGAGYGPPVQPGVAPQLAYGGYAGPHQAPPPQAMSITSMVLGILAIPTTCFYGLGILLAILAVIFGHVGHSQYKRATGQSNGMAVAGLVCGYISLALVVILFLIIFGIAAAANTGR